MPDGGRIAHALHPPSARWRRYVQAGPKAAFPLTLLLLQVGLQAGWLRVRYLVVLHCRRCCCWLRAASCWHEPVCKPAACTCTHGPAGKPLAGLLQPPPSHCHTATLPHCLQAPLLRGEPAVQARVFDLLYNLSVHGELLYDAAADAVPDDAAVLAEAGGQGGCCRWRVYMRCCACTVGCSTAPAVSSAVPGAPSPHSMPL